MTLPASLIARRGSAGRRKADGIRLAQWATWLLVLTALLGGTGADIPVRGMLIELPAIALLVAGLLSWRGARPHPAFISALGLLVAVPLLQLVPLPFAFWSALPGRDVGRDVAIMLGHSSWHPLSLDPDKTLKSLLSILPALALYVAVRQSPIGGRVLVLRAMVAIGLVSIAFGMIQIAARTSWFYPFASAHEGYPIGLFANRNHQATLLVVAALAAAGLYRIAADDGDRVSRTVLVAIIAVFGAGVFATASRTGIALFGLGLVASLPLMLGRHLSRRSLAIAGGLLAVAGLAGSATGVARTAIDRYAASSHDPRFEIWPEVLYSIGHYFPAGAGMGTFVTSFRGTEQLAAVGSHYVNRAHSDYLELLVEAGAAGGAMIAAFLLFCGIAAWQVFVRDPRDKANVLARVALLAILVYLLHSLVDYPLRTFVHLTFIGSFCGLLARPPEQSFSEREAQLS